MLQVFALDIFALTFNSISILLVLIHLILIYKRLERHASLQYSYRLAVFVFALVSLALVQAESIIVYHCRNIEDVDCSYNMRIGYHLSYAHNVTAVCGLICYGLCYLQRFERLEFNPRMSRILRMVLLVLGIPVIPLEIAWKLGKVLNDSNLNGTRVWPYEIPLAIATSLQTIAFFASVVIIEFYVNIKLLSSVLQTNADHTHPTLERRNQLKISLKWRMVFLFSLVVVLDLVIILLAALPVALHSTEYIHSWANIALSWAALHTMVSFSLLDMLLKRLKEIKGQLKAIKHESSISASPWDQVRNQYWKRVMWRKEKGQANVENSSETSKTQADAVGGTFLSTGEFS